MTETIELKHPVDVNGVRLDKVEMRRPTLGDVISCKVRFGENDLEGESRLVAKLCGINPEDIRLLDLSDYLALNARLGRFLQGAEA